MSTPSLLPRRLFKVEITTNSPQLKFRKLWPPADPTELEKVHMVPPQIELKTTRRHAFLLPHGHE